uniref:Low molecular weight phosphotyrosine protein phosphatase n=1 Tax=Strigamia maritima TaxID=126957 RepID=T1IH30_STRMM
MASSSTPKSVLFVCLGNICRSPIAEAVFNHVAKEKGVESQWTSDSAAIGSWHIGKNPDHRARSCMKEHNIAMDHKARQVKKADFNKFNVIFGMDDENINDLKSIAPDSHTASIELLGKYDPEGKTIIRDPYYDDGAEGFEEAYIQCLRCCKAFLEKQ